MSARPEPDLGAFGYEEIEYLLEGTATSYAGHLPADFVTRLVVRRPVAAPASGTLLVEWFNVSSGMDAAPDWTFAVDEIVRAGHAWVGVSAQYVGVEGGVGSVRVADLAAHGLRAGNPDRYAEVHHPGDAYAYDIYTQAADAVRDLVDAAHVLAVGESQSAIMLTTYVNCVQSAARLFDGFLIHSRAAVAGPLGAAGAGVLLDEVFATEPVCFRDDLDVPVLVVQAEGDLFDRIGFLPARQPDGPLLRLWEVAGSAHADRYVIGEFEEILGCAVPVNCGQQWAVIRAAVRALDVWARGGPAPPSASRLEIDCDGDGLGHDFVRDRHGLVVGGVRTPVVDAPAQVVSGRPWPDSSSACRLFGSTTPLVEPAFASPSAYLVAYEAATDAAIAAGFICAEDRDAVLAEARPDLVPQTDLILGKS